MAAYGHRRGDWVTVSFDPQAGNEQKGRRSALVVSNTLFNQHTGLAIVCPVTNTDRRFPFHLPLPDGSKLTGFVMVEQIKSIDYRQRAVRYVERAPAEFLDSVLDLIDACIR